MPESSEPKQTEGVTREREGRFPTPFEQRAVGIALVSPDGRWLWVNQHLCDILGYGHDEMIRLTFGDITHPDDLEADLSQARQLMAGEITTYTTQKRYVRKDRSFVYVKVTVSLIRMPQGQPDHLGCVVEDVTQRRLALELFRTLADSIPQLCWIADSDGCVVWYNRRCVEYTGRTLEQLWGRRLLPVLDAEVQPKVLQRWVASVAAGEPFDMEMPIRGEDGVYRPFLTRVQAARDDGGRVAWWFGTHTDISEMKRVEAALRASERTYRIVADNTYDFEFWRAPQGQYLYVSPSSERVSGYKAAEFLADPDLLLRLVHEEDRPRFEERKRAITAAPSCVEFEFRIIHRDGAVRWLAQACQPVFSEHGEYLGLRGSNREVTDRKRAEEALREADRRKDEFLVTLAHELRNPLASIRNALQILRLSPDPQDLEQARSVMQRQLAQIVRLVDDFLDVSRISMGKVELRREPTQLQAVVHSAVETSRPLVEHMGHEITIALPDEPIVVDADQTRLAQVISNLLINSAKYTDRGGHIWLTAEREGAEAVVSVKDNGIGIAANQLPGLFQMYSQVERSLERAQGGLGIGRTLVKRLVEMHGGSITAKSEGPGKGSEFVIRLPVAERPDAVRLIAKGPNEAVRKAHILVVDDNIDTARGMATLLKLIGHDVATAHSGPQAIEAAQTHRPDVILLDLGLPGMDGYEVAKRLRQVESCQDAVIVAASGYGQEEDRRRAKEAGFNYHLVKPIDFDALKSLLFERAGG